MRIFPHLWALVLAAACSDEVDCDGSGCSPVLRGSKIVVVAAEPLSLEVCVASTCAEGTLTVRELEVGHCEELAGELAATACIGRPLPPELPPPRYNRELEVTIDPTVGKKGDVVSVRVERQDQSVLVDHQATLKSGAYIDTGSSCGPECARVELEL